MSLARELLITMAPRDIEPTTNRLSKATCSIEHKQCEFAVVI